MEVAELVPAVAVVDGRLVGAFEQLAAGDGLHESEV